MKKDDLNENEDIQLEAEEEFVEEEGVKEKLKKLRQELTDAKKEAKENLDGWQRARADYANLKKETEEQMHGIRKRAIEDVIQDVLPTLDTFEMAMKNREVWEKVDKNWRQGIEHIYNQLKKTLEDYGLKEISCEGSIDHMCHEAIETLPAEKEKDDDMIAEVIQKGYELNGKILRASKVKVYKVN